MPVAHWSFFKVVRIKVCEILLSKFEQGVGKHEWQVADLQNVKLLNMILSTANSHFMFDPKDSCVAIIKSGSAVNSSLLFKVSLFSSMYAFC